MPQSSEAHPGLQRPVVSVIVPVRNGEHFLPASLPALQASDLPRGQWELIVVDDSSSDRSAEIAAAYADRVIRLTDDPCGPAVARNRGAAAAAGDILAFVDADVCVHPDVLRRFLETLNGHPDLSAVFGAYDLAPTAPGLVSQYRNLLHRYVHERDAGPAVTFWAGCGAIRAQVFATCGGFDEAQCANTSVEDIQLGYRISALGYRILLDPEIQGRHMKRWTLRSMILTDVRGRGIPWMRLLLSGKVRPSATLNLRPAEQVCTVLAGLCGAGVVAWLWTGEKLWLGLSAAAAGAILAANATLLTWFGRHRGRWFALRVMPLRILYYALNVVSVGLALLPFAFGGLRQRSASKAVTTSGGSSTETTRAGMQAS
jgi:GT2 family glycosyltransferase